MDAIILVGGRGTRLQPLTTTRHKSLVPLCNRPAIEYLFGWLEHSGIERVVLAIGQHNEDLAAAYPARRHGGIAITQVIERERLESGGAIRYAVEQAAVEGRFLVLNGDIFADFDLRAAVAEHERHEADLTLALYPVEDPSQFGVAKVEESGLITGFVEKPPPGTEPSNLINAGVWIFEPGLVAEIPPGAVRVEETLFPSLVARGRAVHGYQFDGLWADIGTPARYLEISRALIGRGDVAVAESATVHGTVTGSAVGPGTTVAKGAAVRDSILWESVVVEDASEIERCILADGVTVGRGARVTETVAGSNATIPPWAVVPAGTTIDAGSTFGASDD